jgi:diaminopimelate decarboxylase
MKNSSHFFPHAFEVEDGCLCVGSVPVTRLAQRVGSTPFYAYDRALLTQKVESLRAIMPNDLRLHYSIKANPMSAVVQHMARLVDGLDVASSGELKIALETEMPTEKISFAGPGKTDGDLAKAIASEVVIHIESRSELTRAHTIALKCGVQPIISLRVNPDFELRSSGMKMGGGAKPFGIDAELIPGILHELRAMDLQFHGFQIFCGSQNLNHTSIIDAQRKIFELAIRLSEHAPYAPRLLNIGGGFGIPYFPGEQALDIKPIADFLHGALLKLKGALPNTDLAIESGRYLVGEAGVYIAKVVDKKTSRGQTFLITDGGMHHHLAVTGNLGQVIRKNYPVAIANKMLDQDTEIVNIVGPLCTPLDVLAEKMALPIAEIGDLVAIFQSGAYGLSASPVNFLSHERASEILV